MSSNTTLKNHTKKKSIWNKWNKLSISAKFLWISILILLIAKHIFDKSIPDYYFGLSAIFSELLQISEMIKTVISRLIKIEEYLISSAHSRHTRQNQKNV